MSGFDEIRLPELEAYGSTRKVIYSTSVYENDTFVEHRVSKSPKGRRKYTISKENLSNEEVLTLENFFIARKGSAYGFRYKDWADYKATDEPLVNGGGTTIQLIKTYGDSIREEVRKIIKPVSGSVTLKKEGVAWASSGNWSLDTTTGIITMNTSHPGDEITWSGEFDTPVRYVGDEFNAQWESLMIFNCDNIELLELLY